MTDHSQTTPPTDAGFSAYLAEKDYPLLRVAKTTAITLPFAEPNPVLQRLFGQAMAAILLTVPGNDSITFYYQNIARLLVEFLRASSGFRDQVAREASKVLTVQDEAERLRAVYRGYVMRLAEDGLAILYARDNPQRLQHALRYSRALSGERLHDAVHQALSQVVAQAWPEAVSLAPGALTAAAERLPYQLTPEALLSVKQFLGAPA